MKILRSMLRRLRAGTAGQALTEFAIVIPLLMVILVGIFEFGRAWHIRQVVTNAAREGARTAVLPDVGSDSVTAVISAYLTSANIDPAQAVITLNVQNSSGSPDEVTVSYDYQFDLIGGVITLISGGSLPGQVTLASTSVMRNE